MQAQAHASGRGCTRLPTVLLDLPDEILSRVLTNLLGSANGLQGRSLSAARNAFALALSCQRLFELFRAMLHTIDPRSSTNPHVAVMLSPCLAAPHLTAVLRMAQHTLRMCRLPTVCAPYNCELLLAVARQCPELVELAFTGEHGLTEDVAKSLFSRCKKLQTVHVLEPGFSVLGALASSQPLRSVTLLAICPEHVRDLIHFLSERGGCLSFLHVGFDVESQGVGHVPAMQKLETITNTFFCFVRKSMKTTLPLLETLHFDTSISHFVEHSYFAIYCETLAMLVQEVSDGIATARQLREHHPNAFGLRKIRVRSIEDMIPKCLEGLSGLLSEDTEVSFQFPGAELKFVARDSTAFARRAPYFRYLQLGDDFELYLEEFTGQLDCLETLDLGSSSTLALYTQEVTMEKSHALQALTQAAGAHLREVRCLFPLTADDTEQVEMYLGDALEYCPAVSCLQLPCEFINVVHDAPERFLRSLAAAQGLKALRLTSNCFNSIREAANQPVDYADIAHKSPLLLSRIGGLFPQLRCLQLESLGRPILSQRSSTEPPVLQIIRTAKASLLSLEEELPALDTESFKTQLLGFEASDIDSVQRKEELR